MTTYVMGKIPLTYKTERGLAERVSGLCPMRQAVYFHEQWHQEEKHFGMRKLEGLFVYRRQRWETDGCFGKWVRQAHSTNPAGHYCLV